MPYNARVFRIFIASPSDVSDERDIISKIIQEWNDLNSFDRKVVLLPLRWETHASPELGIKPQDLINRDIIEHADLAVGVFWTRVGTPTERFESGTIEEIDTLGKNGKIVMLYFSKIKAEIESIDLEQLQRLREFKKQTYPNGLIESYGNLVEFRDKLAKQLEIKIRQLISQDRSETETGTSSELSSTLPKLNISFLNFKTKEIFPEKISFKTNLINFKNLDKVPDYQVKSKDRQVQKNNLELQILFQNQTNIDYYREYIKYLKDEAFYVPLLFHLKNESQINIRDVYIEFSLSKKSDLNIRKEKITRPSTETDTSYSFNLFGNKNEITSLKSRDDSFLISFNKESLQPQRAIEFNTNVLVGSALSQLVPIETIIYADCFPMPVKHKMDIEFEVELKELDSLEVLNELGIIK